MLKRVIKRPSGHASVLSLLPLLCVALLLLSACAQRSIIPPPEQEADATNSGGTLTADVDGGTPVDDYDKTSDKTQTPLPVLKKTKLNFAESNALNTLAYTVSHSTKLENLDSQGFETVLSNAKQWLNELQTQTNTLKDTLQTNHSDNSAPGLEKLSERLAQMLEVITTNQGEEPKEGIAWFHHDSHEAVKTIMGWVNKLAESVRYLPDVPPSDIGNSGVTSGDTEDGNDAPDHTGESATENVDAMASASLSDKKAREMLNEQSGRIAELETTVSEQSGKIAELETTVSEQSGKIAELESALNGTNEPKKTNVFPKWFILALVVIIFAFLGFLAWRRKKQRTKKNNVQEKAVQEKGKTDSPNGKDNPVHAVKTTNDSQWEKAEEFLRSSKSPEPSPKQPEPKQPEPKQPEPKPKPQTCYFRVTSQTVTEGQPIYLEKQGNRGEILGVSRNDSPTSNPELYDIYPIISGTAESEDGVIKSGYLMKNVLTSGGTKKCFDIPKQLPKGDPLFVTVRKPAIIQQTGNNQYQLDWKRRGQLSVTSGS